jgi:hypothetical protein
MPVKTIRVRTSSLSGDEIPDGKGAVLRITWKDQLRPNMRADLTEEEATKLAAEYNAEETKRRSGGRARRPRTE